MRMLTYIIIGIAGTAAVCVSAVTMPQLTWNQVELVVGISFAVYGITSFLRELDTDEKDSGSWLSTISKKRREDYRVLLDENRKNK